jgi:hypothetical protein
MYQFQSSSVTSPLPLILLTVWRNFCYLPAHCMEKYPAHCMEDCLLSFCSLHEEIHALSPGLYGVITALFLLSA